MKKRMSMLLSMAVIGAMVVPMAACGSTTASSSSAASSSKSEASSSSEEVAATSTATSEAAPADAADEGKTLNIQCWNEEFKSRITDHYPGYEEVDATHGKIGDVNVVWTITPTDDNAYQNNLDAILPSNADADADNKVDLFLMEADYALKYVNSDVTMSMKDLGITDDDLADQYQYTKDIATDKDGNLKGITWQACSAGFIYNREAAKDVLGTDDPEKVQEAVADWSKFVDVAGKAKEKGYKIVSTTNDTYRVYSNNVSTPWVTDGKVNIDDNIKERTRRRLGLI